MRPHTHQILGTPLHRGLKLTQRERDLLTRAADLLARLDDIAMALNPEWGDHPHRADLVLGEAAMRDLAEGGYQHVEDIPVSIMEFSR